MLIASSVAVISAGTFYVSHSAGATVAEIMLYDQEVTYKLRPRDPSQGIYAVRSVPRSVYDRESSQVGPIVSDDLSSGAIQGRAQLAQTAAAATEAAIGSLAVKDTNNILDVMFIFTPQAYASAGGTDASMNALATLSVAMANDAFTNTNVPLRMRAVRIAQTDYRNYVEVSFDKELIRLRYDYDDFFDTDVHRRVPLGADVVVLFVANTADCGRSYRWATADLAYAVISTDCPDSVLQEISSSIGLSQDRVTEHNFDYSQYGFGYCWDTGPTSCRRSVMAGAGN
jgi:hypothetical protein